MLPPSFHRLRPSRRWCWAALVGLALASPLLGGRGAQANPLQENEQGGVESVVEPRIAIESAESFPSSVESVEEPLAMVGEPPVWFVKPLVWVDEPLEWMGEPVKSIGEPFVEAVQPGDEDVPLISLPRPSYSSWVWAIDMTVNEMLSPSPESSPEGPSYYAFRGFGSGGSITATPGPLPIAAALAGWDGARRLRRRIKKRP